MPICFGAIPAAKQIGELTTRKRVVLSELRSKSVSYTHLDVYKRQGLGGSSAKVRVWCGDFHGQLTHTEPVSYTHLS